MPDEPQYLGAIAAIKPTEVAPRQPGYAIKLTKDGVTSYIFVHCQMNLPKPEMIAKRASLIRGDKGDAWVTVEGFEVAFRVEE